MPLLPFEPRESVADDDVEKEKQEKMQICAN